MPESQEEIDALLAEVNALADEAVSDILDDTSQENGTAAPQADSAASPAHSASTAVAPAQTHAARESTAPRADASTADSANSAAPARPPRRHREDVRRILNLEVPVIVQLAERTMPLSDIINLSTGAIIEFEKPSDSELDLMINNTCIGKGQAVKVGENFGLRVTMTGSVRDRIQAMGG